MRIAVLDAGFVYVGRCTINDGFLIIEDARNIRQWGTTKGLGELRKGPTPKTILDEAGEVFVPISRVIHFLDVDEQAWGKK